MILTDGNDDGDIGDDEDDDDNNDIDREVNDKKTIYEIFVKRWKIKEIHLYIYI